MACLMRWIAVGTILWLSLAPVAVAQDSDSQPSNEEERKDKPTVEEVIVVTASRTEQRLHEVPATMTVLSAADIETIPADDYGDVLRNVPGLNVAQMSARDIQITGRAATSSLATNELVLVDGRTLYLDFFGFVIWDYLPISPREIKQIEVVRGPGSAVWGANAMTGVINVITKSPRELAGTSVILGAGELGTAYGSVTHAGAGDKWSYKLSGTYYEQDPYDRPTGTVPGTGTPFPPFENKGTEQPKVDLRFDYDASDESTWSFSGGWAGTEGIIHTGIGPFDIDSGSSLSYAKVGWNRRAMSVTLFANILDGDAVNFLTFGGPGDRLLLGFDSETYNLDFSNTSVLGTKNILTYGANARQNNYDLSIAPQGDDRDEYGVYLQDEILFGDKVRWVVGARLDNIDPIDDVVSPRTSLLVSPTPFHTLRFSFNRAFRAPSLVENFIDLAIFNPIPFPSGVFFLPTDVMGNPKLDEERLTAFEVSYVGTFGTRTNLTLAVYRNELEDGTDFFPATFYTSDNPPPGWPLPPGVLDTPVFRNRLPETFTYRNIAEIINEGFEASLNGRVSTEWSWYANYSFQEEPEVKGVSADAVNIPPENRFNVGAAYNGSRFFGSGNVNFVDEAFWVDVLDSRFHGPTDSYTQVNVTLGVRFANERVQVSVIGQNIFDEEVQQHVFGDIISRKITGQLRFHF